MALTYYTQPVRYIIGSATADATLTGSYSGNQRSFTAGGMSQLTLYISYTPAEAGRIMSIQVEGSPDRVTFFPIASVQGITPVTGEAITGNFIKTIVSTGASTVKRRLSYPVADLYLRVSVKEDGANFGTINIINLISGV